MRLRIRWSHQLTISKSLSQFAQQTVRIRAGYDVIHPGDGEEL